MPQKKNSALRLTVLGRIPSKKNSKRIVSRGKRVFLIGSQSYLDWKKDVKVQFFEQTKGKITKFEKPVLVQIDVYFPDRRKSDITNKVESILDALVDEGFLEDDKWQCVPELTLTGQYNKENPRAEILIKEI